jgi:AGZA family xanthine/uracil permease-like MFS transporter
MLKLVSGYFRFSENNTSFQQELLAGLTTFATMSYIVVVNPAILEAAGIPKGPSMVATIITAVFGTLLMGLYAKRPFAIAPYMGENAFIAYTVVVSLGYSWQTALGAIFFSGVFFTLITLLNLRAWLANSIPNSLKHSFAVGIGLFLAFLGFQAMDLITLGIEGAPVRLGNLLSPQAILAASGLLLTSFLIIKKLTGGLLIGILSVTLLAFGLDLTPVPQQIWSLPPDISEVFLEFDLAGALTWGFVSVIVSVLVMDFVDTMGSLIGLSARANLLDKEGNLPDIQKPMLVDALSTIVASVCGTTTAGVYIESASGIEAGGRTGFTAVVVALLFFLTLFFSPVLTAIPSFAYGPALVIVGMFMLESIQNIKFNDYTELIPAFLCISLMIFSFNIGVGITAGFIAFPILKLLSGRVSEVKPGMWLLAIASISFYIYYPYH